MVHGLLQIQFKPLNAHPALCQKYVIFDVPRQFGVLTHQGGIF